jgi:hypothetical protein
MKLRKIREDSELSEAATHVSYEIEMLAYSAEQLGSSHASPPATLSENDKHMAMECFLLHFRNIRSFLCPSLGNPPRKNDLVASDYFGNSEATDCAKAATFSLDKDRLDQMLAHLTYCRLEYVSDGNVGWKIAKLTIDVLEELNSFLDDLDKSSSPARREYFPAKTKLEKIIERAKGL